ncbi:GNAT family N-acetyltransferase [Ramlibacter albus]|uniref:GNAT family N-acetyltransferase n=1 Tax=Ramlibacter albus TaxID=2079448 RepID=A0A923MB41_9BURK|nr:GNAT family N-acetyltransferase [Ramlibacter albus]MBC5766108.1 GNAT family N-acetyltransferase [Ramlibacter albus]
MQLPGDPRIVTPRLLLRLVRGDDLPALLRANGDPEVTRYLPYETWAGPDDAVAWYARMEGRRERSEALQFVLERTADRVVIGSALLFNFDEDRASGDVGYLLAREYWGHGYMAEAVEALVAFARDTLRLRELKAVIETPNTASAKLVMRLGFVPVATADGLDTWQLTIG